MKKLKAFISKPITQKSFFFRCLLMEIVETILMNIFISMVQFELRTHYAPDGFLINALVVCAGLFIVRFYEYALTARRAKDIGITQWAALILLPLEFLLGWKFIPVALLVFTVIPSKEQKI